MGSSVEMLSTENPDNDENEVNSVLFIAKQYNQALVAH